MEDLVSYEIYINQINKTIEHLLKGLLIYRVRYKTFFKPKPITMHCDMIKTGNLWSFHLKVNLTELN